MTRTFREIALEIRERWAKPYYGAVLYLDALCEIDTRDPKAYYGYDFVRRIVLYFLANARTWRGEDARRIKAELKEMVK